MARDFDRARCLRTGLPHAVVWVVAAGLWAGCVSGEAAPPHDGGAGAGAGANGDGNAGEGGGGAPAVTDGDGASAQALPCDPIDDGAPSLVDDVVPGLLADCASFCHGAPGVPLTLAPLPLPATREELDAIHGELLAAAVVAPQLRRIEPGDPERSLLLQILEQRIDVSSYSCEGLDHAFARCIHPQGIGPPSSPELAPMVRRWVAAGAPSDACRVPPPSTTPLLRVPLRVHTRHSALAPDELLALIGDVDAVARDAGICFDVELVGFDQRRTDGRELWLLPAPDARVDLQTGSDLDVGDADLLVHETTELGGRSPTRAGVLQQVLLSLGLAAEPTQRQVIAARAIAMRWGRPAPQDGACDPPRVVELVDCGAAACASYDTGFMGLSLPPCCTLEDTCGVEAAAATDVIGTSLVLPFFAPSGCISVELLLTPLIESMPCGFCDSVCAPAVLEDVPILGDLELPGCCHYDGSCGVSSLGLPPLVGDPPTCMDGASLQQRLGPLAPEPPVDVPPTACVPPGPPRDPSCPTVTSPGFPTLAGCCADDGTCGLVIGSECVSQGSTACGGA